MNLTAHIISTSAKRLHTFTAVTPNNPGTNRPLVRLAEDEAREWAQQNNMRIVSDIVSQGEYRAWVEPIPAGRLRTMAQLGRTA